MDAQAQSDYLTEFFRSRLDGDHLWQPAGSGVIQCADCGIVIECYAGPLIVRRPPTEKMLNFIGILSDLLCVQEPLVPSCKRAQEVIGELLVLKAADPNIVRCAGAGCSRDVNRKHPRLHTYCAGCIKQREVRR